MTESDHELGDSASGEGERHRNIYVVDIGPGTTDAALLGVVGGEESGSRTEETLSAALAHLAQRTEGVSSIDFGTSRSSATLFVSYPGEMPASTRESLGQLLSHVPGVIQGEASALPPAAPDHVAAARLKIKLMRRTGRTPPNWLEALAKGMESSPVPE